jgi:hypothetical protein
MAINVFKEIDIFPKFTKLPTDALGSQSCELKFGEILFNQTNFNLFFHKFDINSFNIENQMGYIHTEGKRGWV